MSREARRVERELLRAGANAVRKLQLRVFQALTSATPVLTGFARGGWTPSVGSPVTDQLDPPKEESAAKAAAEARFAENKGRAVGIAASYTLSQGRVFISNPVKYVVYLNEGSSSQAPANFVDRAIETAVQSLVGTGL